jgi:hypothetical protein
VKDELGGIQQEKVLVYWLCVEVLMKILENSQG